MTASPIQSPSHAATGAAATAAAKRHAELVHQTQKWVAQAFYGTLFKQMRQDPFRSNLFDGGRGGQMFQEMLDQNLSERMARGAPNKLVNAIVQKIEGGKASATYLRYSNQPSPALIAPQYRFNSPTGSSNVSTIG
jgi:Rod binding domain-containing protein